MSPYYDDGQCVIYHGDCREVLPSLAFDLVVTSPPYNKGHQSGEYANMRDSYEEHADDLTDRDYVDWQHCILSLCWSRLPANGAIFYNHKPQIRDGAVTLPTRLIPDEVALRQIIIWDRGVGMNWSPGFFCPQHEWVMLLAKQDFVLSSRGAGSAGDVWTIGIERRDYGHPCPFPLALPLKAIQATTADTICDPFMGSGTTLRAAMDLGRKAIGVELSERYCEIAANRLAQGVLDFGGAA